MVPSEALKDVAPKAGAAAGDHEPRCECRSCHDTRDASKRGRALAVHADRQLRLSLQLPHRRACCARRHRRLAVRTTLRLAQRVRRAVDRGAGSFRFGPFGINVPSARIYEPGTNTLVTSWKTPSGWVVIRDALSMGQRRGKDTITPHTRPPADEDADHALVPTATLIAVVRVVSVAPSQVAGHHAV